MANLAANSETHQTQQFFTAMELNEDPRSGTIDDVNPLIFTAKLMMNISLIGAK